MLHSFEKNVCPTLRFSRDYVKPFYIFCLLEEWPDIWRNAYFRDRKCVRIPRVGKWKREKIVFSWRITAVVSLRLHICLTTCENLGLGNQYLRELVWRKLKNVLCETRLCTVQVCMYVNKKNILKLFSCPFNLPAEHILAYTNTTSVGLFYVWVWRACTYYRVPSCSRDVSLGTSLLLG